jgi:hypothetical protein
MVMALLNFENTPYLWTPHNGLNTHINYKNNPVHYSWVTEINNREGDYFYIEYMYDNAFSVYDLATLIEPYMMNKIKTGDVTLILANSGHGYHENVEGVYKDVIIKHSIDPKHIIMRSESFDILEEIKIISEKYNLPMCRYEWVTEFEKSMKEYRRDTDHELPITLQNKSYSKKFISYNGIWRPHRGAIIGMLSAMNILDKGIVSYNSKGNSGMSSNDNYEFLHKFLSYNQELKDLLESAEESIRKLDRIILDVEEGTTVNTAAVLTTDKELYENTYFSLVTETSIPIKPFSYRFDANTDVGRILSEKIFKPISLRHPFLVVSNPKTLELLRSLGYKTFSPLIDESYDDEEDIAKRLLMIVKEVKRLCELTPVELENFLIEAGKICDYNLEILMNKDDYVHPLN